MEHFLSAHGMVNNDTFSVAVSYTHTHTHTHTHTLDFKIWILFITLYACSLVSLHLTSGKFG